MSATLELLAIREIAHAFLVADRPVDVYQLALDRVTPILGAAFSLIMHVGADGELLRPVAQHHWPEKHKNWIGALRVRVGDGPSGLAVAQRRLVEIPDLFADQTLEAWFEVAEELGFRSIVAVPLIGTMGPEGAITFYFTDPTAVTDEQRALVRLVAEQLAATADKAALLEAMRRANAALAEANAALEREVRSGDEARRARDLFLTTLTRRVSESMSSACRSADAASMLRAARATAAAAEELAAIESGAAEPELGDVEPRSPLVDAVQAWRTELLAIPMTHGEPTVLLPTMRSDARWMTRLLSLLIGQVIQRHDGRSAIHADVELGRGFVAHRLEWEGEPLPDLTQSLALIGGASAIDVDGSTEREGDDGPARHPDITPLDLALAVALVRRLGGDIQRDEPIEGISQQGATVVFPVDDGRG